MNLKTITLVVLLACSSMSWAQRDSNRNPIFNSEEIGTEYVGSYTLKCYYYSINDNIDNKQSSVYMSDAPSAQDYISFSRKQPSYFFLLRNQEEVKFIIGLNKTPNNVTSEFTYLITNPNNGKAKSLPCTINGDITEKRANELIRLKIDNEAEITTTDAGLKELRFSESIYTIQDYGLVLDEVLQLAQNLIDFVEMANDPMNFIRQESIGGNLDFIKILTEEDQQPVIIDNVLYMKEQYAFLLWGKAVQQLGVSSSKKAIKLWEDIHSRKLTQRESNALVKGYAMSKSHGE